MCEICWSSKNSTNHLQVGMIIQESPANSQRGRRRSSVGWHENLPILCVVKSAIPQRKYWWTNQFLYLNLFAFVRFLFLISLLQFGRDLWLLYIFTLILSLWLCLSLCCDFLFDGGFVHENDFDYKPTVPVDSFKPSISQCIMWSQWKSHIPCARCSLFFSTGDESSVVYDQHEVPVGF